MKFYMMTAAAMLMAVCATSCSYFQTVKDGFATDSDSVAVENEAFEEEAGEVDERSTSGAKGMVFAYESFDYGDESLRSGRYFVYPTEDYDEECDVRWAVFHNEYKPLEFCRNLAPVSDENSMPCYCSDLSRVNGKLFKLATNVRRTSAYDNEGPLMLVSDEFKRSHTLLKFKDYEDEVPMPASFRQMMAQKYGRKVKYSYHLVSLTDASGAELSVTEFELKGNEGLVVIALSEGDDIICTHTETTTAPDDYDGECGLWNVDDNGDFGCPSVIAFMRTPDGNIELCYVHFAPETVSPIWLRQKGEKFEVLAEDGWYVWYQ